MNNLSSYIKAKFVAEQELFEKGMIDKIIKKFKGKTPEEKREFALKVINAHPAKRLALKKMKAKHPERVEAYLMAIAKKPKNFYWTWDEKTKSFLDSEVVGNITPAG